MKESRRIACCGMMSALSVVLMLVGSVLGVGMYASPILAGLCLLPIGREYGRKYQIIMWLSVSVLCFMLVQGVEQNLMYFAVFGIYPVIRPAFERLGKPAHMIAKLGFFNAVVVAVEALVMMVLVPEALGAPMLIALLLMGNLVFVLYDFMTPRFEFLLSRYLKRILK